MRKHGMVIHKKKGFLVQNTLRKGRNYTKLGLLSNCNNSAISFLLFAYSVAAIINLYLYFEKKTHSIPFNH